MKIRNKVILFIGFIALIGACTNSKNSEYKSILNLEEEVYSMKMVDKAKGADLINAYVGYAKTYPNDTASIHFLFKAGDIAMNMNMGSQAVLYYDKVLVMDPEYRKAPECLFLKAFIYENQMSDLEQAKKYYELFLEKYPDHVLAKDAKASLMYLGKSPEELIKMFQEMNK